MITQIRQRTTGPLFEEDVWGYVNGVFSHLIITGDDIGEPAFAVSAENGETLLTGEITFIKTCDEQGRLARAMVFRHDGENIVLSESILSAVQYA